MEEQLESNKNNTQKNGASIAVLLIGRSGSGKGTQAKLLIEYMKEQGRGDILYSYTGEMMREFVDKENNLASTLVKKIMEDGNLIPSFMAGTLWSNRFIKNIKKGTSVVVDGSPRALLEAHMMDEALNFYNINNVKPVLLETSRQWSTDRMLERGSRADDNKESVERRMNYYDDQVVPVIKYYEEESKFKLIKVNGEQSIEDVHQEMIRKIFGN